MKLYEILENNGETSLPDMEISTITDNTAKVVEGCIFVCIKGGKFDGHSAAAEMLEKGAAAVVCDHDLGLGDKQIITENTRKLYGNMCSAFFGHPERKMKLIGVTGTNGKTTITNVIKHILTFCGHKTGLVGTIQNEIGNEIVHTENTTPMAFELMELFERMHKADCEYVVMEVSSFGLVQNRVGASFFDVAAFTNLTQDHLDYHKDMEDYYQAKKILFDVCGKAVINVDDSYGKRLFGEISCSKYGFSINGNEEYSASDIKISSSGSEFTFRASGKEYSIRIKIPGMFNVYNVSQAMAVCLESGLTMEEIIPAVESYCGVKGRCEIIPTNTDFTVICDYAHTPDAVENILKSVKEYTEGRLICLFGCGGNRDAAKRPKMAKAAAKYADKIIVTSDNPRNEEPGAIIKDILKGLEGVPLDYDVVEDRREAIYHSLKIAGKGDIIVLAGKGHEDYQILANNLRIHFDEREVVADGLKLI